MKVLVLCTGNRWRSPLLSYSLSLVRPHWQIRSAGTRCSKPGSDVPKAWRASVAGWSAPHSAKKFTIIDAEWADVIVCTQKSHVKEAALWKPEGIIFCALPDPAFRPVSTWASLSALYPETALSLVRLIESDTSLKKVLPSPA